MTYTGHYDTPAPLPPLPPQQERPQPSEQVPATHHQEASYGYSSPVGSAVPQNAGVSSYYTPPPGPQPYPPTSPPNQGYPQMLPHQQPQAPTDYHQPQAPTGYYQAGGSQSITHTYSPGNPPSQTPQTWPPSPSAYNPSMGYSNHPSQPPQAPMNTYPGPSYSQYTQPSPVTSASQYQQQYAPTPSHFAPPPGATPVKSGLSKLSKHIKRFIPPEIASQSQKIYQSYLTGQEAIVQKYSNTQQTYASPPAANYQQYHAPLPAQSQPQQTHYYQPVVANTEYADSHGYYQPPMQAPSWQEQTHHPQPTPPTTNLPSSTPTSTQAPGNTPLPYEPPTTHAPEIPVYVPSPAPAPNNTTLPYDSSITHTPETPVYVPSSTQISSDATLSYAPPTTHAQETSIYVQSSAQASVNTPPSYMPPTTLVSENPVYVPSSAQAPNNTTLPYNPSTTHVPEIPVYVPSSAPVPADQHNGAPTHMQQDPVMSLVTHLDGLRVREEPQTVPVVTKSVHSPDQAPREAPPVRATGSPNEVVSYCPEGRTVAYSLNWYCLPDVPDYLVCTRCHDENIRGTSLAHHFNRVKQEDGTESTCGFWRPRVKEILWPGALRSGGLDQLQSFMKKRLDMIPCKGIDSRPASDNVKWYKMREDEIKGFITCEACFEDRVVGTDFESRFDLMGPPTVGQNWSCDLGIPYMSRAIDKMSKRNDWSSFVAEATRRFSLPTCEGKGVRSNECNWYHPRRTIEDMHVCEACFMDKVELTMFENEFERYVQPSGFDAWLETLGQRWTCALAGQNVPMNTALDGTLWQRNYAVFWEAASKITKLVPCTEHGIIRGNWWTLTGGCDGLNVCEACYTGVLEVNGVAKFFESVARDQEATIVCNFCTRHPRFRQFADKFTEGTDKGVFSFYIDHVKKFASVPACAGIKSREKTKWWGYPEALCCQDCYLSFVTGTELGESVPVKEMFDERAMCCQFWSPRMRKMWLEVCAAGPAGSEASETALNEFKAFGTRRMNVYNATVPHIEMMIQMQSLKMMQAMHHGQMSLMYQGMNSMAVLSDTTDGYLHGNSSLGYYETENGVTGAQEFEKMQAGMASANAPSESMKLRQLQMMWMEVE